MKHFTNINSLAELKKQYRTLAITNHPDKGGKVEIMQEINSEYDQLYKIWVNAMPEQARPSETAEQSRKFYTANGWEGKNYNSNLTTQEIAKRVREYAKKNWPGWKFSIRCKFASMCSEIQIELKGGPLKSAIVDGSKWGVQTAYRFGGTNERVNPLAEVVMKDVIQYLQSYNYNDSDGMIDYFDTNFYIFERVAGNEWEEIYKTARIKAKETTVQPVKVSEIEIVDYSEKAIAVFGNTKAIKDELKEIGGRFNPSLNRDGKKCAGWIFSKKKREEVEKLIA